MRCDSGCVLQWEVSMNRVKHMFIAILLSMKSNRDPIGRSSIYIDAAVYQQRFKTCANRPLKSLRIQLQGSINIRVISQFEIRTNFFQMQGRPKNAYMPTAHDPAQPDKSSMMIGLSFWVLTGAPRHIARMWFIENVSCS